MKRSSISMPRNQDANNSSIQGPVTVEECVTHLRLLTAFSKLRHDISTSDRLFGIEDSEACEFTGKKRNLAKARIREKRWAVYVSKAVDRFISWWQTCIPDAFVDPASSLLSGQTTEIARTADTLPPIDVLMVLHSYMLHPRSFLADCIRLSKMGFWTSGMHWGAVGACIEEKTFSYYPGDKAIRHFESRTGLAWESLEDPPKTLTCLRCKAGIDTPWTTATNVGYDPDVAFAHCTGLADKSFRVQCASCRFSITHANLRVSQFRRDVQALLKDGTPMPGTILGLRGTPAEKDNQDSSFPNRLIMGIKVELLERTDPAKNENTSIESIRSILERSLKNRRLMCQVNNTVIPTSISHSEGIFIRRMMSSYWDNASPFSLDLTGAVIRQGQFIEKIEQLKWLQSPSLPSTMSSLIAKYGVFMDIMILNQDRAAVPTLDVDLVWHTHQLSPSRYYAFSTQQTSGILIDHDDKIDEVKISDAFEWTSKQYQKLTGGKVYSECTCWYCEAVRESQNRLSSLASLSSALSGRSNASIMSSSNSNVQSNGNPHISSHNAVRAQGQAAPRASEAKTEELKKSWEKVRRRNEKSAGKKRHSFTQDSGHDVDIPSQISIWGVPCDLPQHGPYMRDPGVHEDIYPSDPLCMNVALGAAGNCVAGTDREAVKTGGCVAGMAMSETPGKHRGGRPGFCQGSGSDGMSGGMF